MPAIRRPRVDVVLRVPKHQPYSEAKAKDIEAAAAIAGRGGTGDASAPGPSSNGIPLVQVSEPSLGTIHKQEDQSALAGPISGPDHTASATNGDKSDANAKKEDEEPELPMARSGETSSAEWNSLLIWARRMRGPQWDSGLGIWQVDRESQEYYTFCADPKQSVHGPSRSAGDAGEAADAGTTNGAPAIPPSLSTSESSSQDSKYAPLASAAGASAFSPSMRPSTASPRQDPATAPSARPGSRNGPGPSSLSTTVETGSALGGEAHSQRPGSRRGQQDPPGRPQSRRRRPTMSSISGRSSSRRSSFSSGSSSPRSRSGSPDETPSSPPNAAGGPGGGWGATRPPQRTDVNGIPGHGHGRQQSFSQGQQQMGFAGQQGELGGGYPGPFGQ